MQQDVIQQTVETIARTDGATRWIAIFLAAVLVFIMVGGWLLIAYREQARLSVATVVRLVCIFGFSYIVGKILGHIVIDPRPYIVEHVAPLMPVATDNGFPSDHTLLASALTATMWWLRRRWSVLFCPGNSAGYAWPVGGRSTSYVRCHGKRCYCARCFYYCGACTSASTLEL